MNERDLTDLLQRAATGPSVTLDGEVFAARCRQRRRRRKVRLGALGGLMLTAIVAAAMVIPASPTDVEFAPAHPGALDHEPQDRPRGADEATQVVPMPDVEEVTPGQGPRSGSPAVGSATGEAPVAVEEGIDLEPSPGEGHPCAKSNKAQRAALAPVASPEGGMAVRASPLTVSPGEPLYVVVTNTTAGSYGTGLYCRVEQWRDDGWEAAHYVRPDTGEYAYPSQYEAMVLWIFDPGQSIGLRVDTTFLQPGRYRTTHEFDGRGSTTGTTVVVDFEVVDERG